MEKVRIDKWLWSVRIFKSRTLASDTCKKGKVKINDVVVKPSAFLRVGDIITTTKEGFNLTFKAVELISKRVSATLAEPCYENLTPEAEMNKFKAAYLGGTIHEIREKGAGRPTKKERREIEKHKNK